MEVIQKYDFEIDHIPGKTNVVTDALSRRPDFEVYAAYPPLLHKPDASVLRMNAITRMQTNPTLHEQVCIDAESDTEYKRHIKLTEQGKKKDMVIKNGLLYHTAKDQCRLYVPVGPLRVQLLTEAHDIPRPAKDIQETEPTVLLAQDESGNT